MNGTAMESKIIIIMNIDEREKMWSCTSVTDRSFLTEKKMNGRRTRKELALGPLMIPICPIGFTNTYKNILFSFHY
jgi:hypothetical protein